jgi:hypothetical protein
MGQRLVGLRARLYRFVWMTDPPAARAARPAPRSPPRAAPGIAPPAPVPPPAVAETSLIDVPARHVDALMQGLRGAGWQVEDTGRTVTTDDGMDELTTIRIGIPAPRAPLPVVKAAIYASGDLVLGEGLILDATVMASGDLVVGRDTTVQGSVSAGRDLVLEEGAVTGDAFAGGHVRMADSARCSALVAKAGAAPDAPA